MSDTKTEQAGGDTGADMDSIAPRRGELLRWLAEDARKPDELGEKWWDEFEAFLREHRLKIVTMMLTCSSRPTP